MIASQYRICEEERDPVVKDGVAITAEQVCVKQNCSTEWRTFCKTKPASVTKIIARLRVIIELTHILADFEESYQHSKEIQTWRETAESGFPSQNRDCHY